MDPKENPLWFAQQLVDTLQREVALKETELAALLSHKAMLLQAFSIPTFPPGYAPTAAVPTEQYNWHQDRSDPRPSATSHAAGQSVRSDKGKSAQVPAVETKHNTSPHRRSRPADHGNPSQNVQSELETSDDSQSTSTPRKGQNRNYSSTAVTNEPVIRNASARHVTSQSDSGDSSESSESKTEPSPSAKWTTNHSKFPEVIWTDQIERTTTSLNGDSSSDTEDSVSSEASADKGRSNVMQPTSTGKDKSSAAGPAMAASQAPSLSSDAPPEDLFDWEVLALSGPWSLVGPSSLLSKSSWSQQQKQQSSLPCKFETIDEYKSTFEGLIFEECKAHLTSSWELMNGSVPGTSQNSSHMQGVPEVKGDSNVWHFRLMYPSANDPFNYVEVEQCMPYIEGRGIRLDPCELVLLTHDGTTVLAMVTLTNKKIVLLKTRSKLPAFSGQCTLTQLANVVTLKRQYVSLLKASEIWDPLQRQLLDPQENSSFVISPPSNNCLEEDVKVTSCIEPILTWKNYGKFNNKQLVAMEALLQLKQGFLLVQGMVSAVHIDDPRARILVCASSNAAVDEIVYRLMHHMVDKSGNSYTPARGTLLRLGVQTSIQPACRPVTLDSVLECSVMGSKSTSARREVVASASIVCCTISGSGNQIFDELNQKFDLLIIDEAAQALESEVLIALRKVNGRCVMVGDPCQLPAVVLQRPGAAYGRSLFERMQEARCPIFLMTTQYRMHPHISQFPSTRFYGGHLMDSSQSQNMRPIFMERAHETGVDICGYNFKLGAYLFLDVTWGMEKGELVGYSLSNIDEAAVVAAVVQGVVSSLRDGTKPNIGVITPYLAQRSVIMANLEQHGLDEKACEVNTVDGFQGREKDIIILSCVRAQTDHGLGFVSDVRRMNVALTRARHSLIIVGHAETLRRQSPIWNALIEDASIRNLYQLLRHKPRTVKTEAIHRNAYDPGANVATGIRQSPHQRRFEQGGSATTTGPGQRPHHIVGQKRKAHHSGIQLDSRNQTVKPEPSDQHRKRNVSPAMLAVGRMRGQISNNGSGPGWFDSSSHGDGQGKVRVTGQKDTHKLWSSPRSFPLSKERPPNETPNSYQGQAGPAGEWPFDAGNSVGASNVMEAVTGPKYNHYGHIQASQVSEWPVDRGNFFDGNERRRVSETGEKRNGSNSRGRGGGKSRGSARFPNRNRGNVLQRGQPCVIQKQQDSQLSRYGNNAGRGKKKGKGEFNNSNQRHGRY